MPSRQPDEQPPVGSCTFASLAFGEVALDPHPHRRDTVERPVPLVPAVGVELALLDAHVVAGPGARGDRVPVTPQQARTDGPTSTCRPAASRTNRKPSPPLAPSNAPSTVTQLGMRFAAKSSCARTTHMPDACSRIAAASDVLPALAVPFNTTTRPVRLIVVAVAQAVPSASSTPFLRAANATSVSAGVDARSAGSVGSPATSTHEVQPPYASSQAIVIGSS